MTITAMSKKPEWKRLARRAYLLMRDKIEGDVRLTVEQEEEHCFRVFKDTVDLFHKSQSSRPEVAEAAKKEMTKWIG